MSTIKVRSVTDSFRRGGFTFTREPKELDTEKLKKGVLDQLRAEPNLVVEDVADADKKTGGDKK